MKRTALLKRSPLRARTGLSRTVPLKVTAGLSRKPLGTGRARKPAKGSRPTLPPAARTLVDARDQLMCQRCGSSRDLDAHHRRIKGSGGSRRAHTDCPCNTILLCRSCHHWAHVVDRPCAEAEGFIVSRSVAEPGSVSVMRFAAASGGASMFAWCDGQWSSAPQGERAA